MYKASVNFAELDLIIKSVFKVIIKFGIVWPLVQNIPFIFNSTLRIRSFKKVSEMLLAATLKKHSAFSCK